MDDPRKLQFLAAVVGDDGAKALVKASERAAELDQAIVPRCILAWLDVTARFGHDGTIPGIEDVKLSFKKSEGGFQGVVTLGGELHHFEKASLEHLAGCVAVALGLDHERITTANPQKLAKLGKSIDLLIKSRSTLAKMAIADIPPGPSDNDPDYEQFNYSHVLPEQHQKAGYKLVVEHVPNKSINAYLTAPGSDRIIGNVRGELHGNVMSPHSRLDPRYRGQKLGQAMYEAVFAHGYHNDISRVRGEEHTEDAYGVHSALAHKHGLRYEPAWYPEDEAGEDAPAYSRQTPRDAGPYAYTLKNEIKPEQRKKIKLPGTTAAPRSPQQPIAPTPIQPKNLKQAPAGAAGTSNTPPLPQLPKQPKRKPTASITKSEAQSECAMCGRHAFSNGKYVGCLCFSSLSKNIKTTASEEGYTLEFTGLDQDEITTLLEGLRGK